jgi:hypothetical protein
MSRLQKSKSFLRSLVAFIEEEEVDTSRWSRRQQRKGKEKSFDSVGEKSSESWGDPSSRSHDHKSPTRTSTTLQDSTQLITRDADIPIKTTNKSKKQRARHVPDTENPLSSPKPGATPEVSLDDGLNSSSGLTNKDHSPQNVEESTPSIEIGNFKFLATSLPPQ